MFSHCVCSVVVCFVGIESLQFLHSQINASPLPTPSWTHLSLCHSCKSSTFWARSWGEGTCLDSFYVTLMRLLCPDNDDFVWSATWNASCVAQSNDKTRQPLSRFSVPVNSTHTLTHTLVYFLSLHIFVPGYFVSVQPSLRVCDTVTQYIHALVSNVVVTRCHSLTISLTMTHFE